LHHPTRPGGPPRAGDDPVAAVGTYPLPASAGDPMSDALTDWPRNLYQGPGGTPFLFYVVFGAFSELPALSRQEYRSNGLVPGLPLSHYGRGQHPDLLDRFRQGYLWDELSRHQPGLAEAVQEAGECLLLRGELEDQSDLNYLRDMVGLLTFLLDQGGIMVFDP